MKTRRFLSLILALAMCLGLAAPALAADLTYAVTGGNLYFDATTGTITKADKTVTEANIPSEIYGVPVTAIGSAFSGSNLERVTIPSSVTTIGGAAFYHCTKLTEIVIPNSVTSMGEKVFFECYDLSSVTLGRGLTSIPRETFVSCLSLKSITLPDNITSIGYQAFRGSGLESITIPESVTLISGGAFESCASLTSVYIPDSVTKMDDLAFYDCTALTDVRLSDTMAEIPSSAFGRCDSLASIVIPRSVQSIGNSAFSSCKKLNSITIPRSVTYISVSAFDGASLTDVYYEGGALEWSQIGGGLNRGTIHFSEPVSGFEDVYTSDYYADAVKWAAEKGVTTGTSATTFSPAMTVTRAQAVTFLWRAAGQPEPASAVSTFSDVTDTNAYYYKAVLWAAEQGITNGVGGGIFGLEGTLPYDQIFAFLCRAVGGSTSGSDWSAAAVNWAEENGLTDGLSFSAKADCPRADLVYCLWKELA